MNSPDDQTIVVKVEVHIPFTGQLLKGDRKFRTRDASGIDILCPTLHMHTAVRSTSQANYICARGTAVLSLQAARTVYARVQAVGDAILDDPPAGTWAVKPDSSGNWSFQ